MAKRTKAIRWAAAAACAASAISLRPGFRSNQPIVDIPIAHAEEKAPPVGIDIGYHGNSAGQVVRGQFMLRPFSLPLKLGLGGGVLDTTYFNPQPYALGSAGLDASPSESLHIFSRGSASYFPETTDTRRQYFPAITAGASMELLPSDFSISLRAGLEISGLWALTDYGINQNYRGFGAGASAGSGPVTAYGLARWNFREPDTRYQRESDKRPFFTEMKSGIMLWNLIRGSGIGAEFETAPYHKGAGASLRLPDAAFSPEFSFGYRITDELFGRESIFSFGIAMSFDKGGMSRLSARQEFGEGSDGVEYERLVGFDRGQLEKQRENLLMAAGIQEGQGNGISPMGIRRESDILRTRPGRDPDLTKSMVALIKRKRSADEAEEQFGSEQYGFLMTFMGSRDFYEFSRSYASSGFEEKIRAAAMISSLGLAYFNKEMKGGRNPDVIRSMSPEDVYSNLRRRIVGGENTGAGNCANIHGMAVEFLRMNGVQAYAMLIGSHEVEHTVVVARDPDTGAGYLVNYYEIYKGEGNGIWPAVQAYARRKRVNIIGVYIFRDGNWRPAFYEGPEGRLIRSAIWNDEDLLRGSLLKRKGPGN